MKLHPIQEWCYKHFTKRDLLYFLAGIILFLGAEIVQSLQTKDGFGSVVDYSYNQKVNIERYVTSRAYERESLPSCVWDIDHERRYRCTARDTLGKCVRGYWYSVYDYSYRTWKRYCVLDSTFHQEKDIKDIDLSQYSVDKYRVDNRKTTYYVTVKYQDQLKEFRVSRAVFLQYSFMGRIIPIKVRRRSNKMVNIKK